MSIVTVDGPVSGVDGTLQVVVTSSHEALHRIFQRDPNLFARTFTRLGINFPQPKAVSVLNADLTEIAPLERRVDTALLVDTDSGQHVIVIESQTAPEPSRRFSWPYYVAFLYNRYACPVILLVVTADVGTAGWARQPIHVGLADTPTQTTQPLVLGPDNVPQVTTIDQAEKDLMVAVLSALTHRHGSGVHAILGALAAALARVDEPTALYLAEFTEVGLGQSQAADMWRAIMSTMTYGFESELHRRWRAEGRAEGREEGRAQATAAAVLRVLEARGLAVPDNISLRVLDCTDHTLLEQLLIRAATIEDARDLFVDLTT